MSITDKHVFMIWLIITEYLFHKCPRMCSVCRSHNSVLSAFMTLFVTRVTRRVTHVEQELYSGAPEFSTGFSGVRVAPS
jgi:hypothetical protein